MRDRRAALFQFFRSLRPILAQQAEGPAKLALPVPPPITQTVIRIWYSIGVPAPYDPEQPIDPQAWMELDESERIELVRQYHHRKKISLPNAQIHAVMHVIVENQVALGDAFPAQSVLVRLMEEGLDRHEAIHAIASVLAEQMFAGLKHGAAAGDLQADYIRGIERLTAESWRRQAE